jgi:hypothetical protein
VQASFLMRIITERDMRAGLGGARGMRGSCRTGADGGQGVGLARACGTGLGGARD